MTQSTRERRNCVVHYADLDVAAVAQRREGRDRQLVAWYALRVADAAGAGRLFPEQIDATVRWLRWNPRLSARVLTGGAETFWRLTPGKVLYLRSAARVAIALGVRTLRTAYWAPLADLRRAFGVARARLVLQGIAALRHGRPISNATMAGMARVNMRTITRWKGVAQVRTRENFTRLAPLRPGTVAGDFRAVGGPALRTVWFGGRRWMARRIADSLDVPRLGGVRSRLRHGNRRLRTLSDHPGGDPARRRLYGATRRRPADPSRLQLYTLEGHGRRAGQLVRLWALRPGERDRHFVHGAEVP